MAPTRPPRRAGRVPQDGPAFRAPWRARSAITPTAEFAFSPLANTVGQVVGAIFPLVALPVAVVSANAATSIFFKTSTSMFWGTVFLQCNNLTLLFCLLVILASSYLILRAQTALLYVGGAAAVVIPYHLHQRGHR